MCQDEHSTFMYVFQCLPLFLSIFLHAGSGNYYLYLGGKVLRISKVILQRSRNCGGLALPNFMHYYWAANIQKLFFWLKAPESNWCSLEAQSCHSSSLSALVFSSLPMSPSHHSSNPLVLSTLKIWIQFRCHFKFSSASCLGPISKNHLFTPSILDSAFTLWSRLGINRFEDLYDGDTFSSFDSLCSKFNIPSSHLFRYLQVHHFVHAKFDSIPRPPQESLWERLLKLSPAQRGLISEIYQNTMSLNRDTVSKSKTRWEGELGMDLAEDWWEMALDRVNSSSSCARLCLIQLKILHRAHLSKSKLHEIYPDSDPNCDRCGSPQVDLSHMFWSCPKLGTYWSSIFNVFSTLLNNSLQPCPLLAIFGVSAVPLPCSSNEAGMIAFAMLLARCRILLTWKSPTSPSFSAWLKDMMSFLHLEKIKFTLRGFSEHFLKKWQLFVSYFNSLSALPPD